MLNLPEDPMYREIYHKLMMLSKQSCEVGSLFNRYLDDHQIRLRERKRTDKEILKDRVISDINNYINSVIDIEDKKYLSGHIIFEVMRLSVDENNTKKKNLFLGDSIDVISSIVENHPLTDKTRNSVRAYLRGNRVKQRVTRKALEKLDDKWYSDPLEKKGSENIFPSTNLINEYVRYLYNCSLDYNTSNITAHPIFELIKKNTTLNGMDIIQPTIFEEAKKIKAINKKLVLEVAKTYAKGLDEESIYFATNNQAFDNSMEKMFSHIVTTYGYNPKEVEELKQTLIDNSQDREFSKRMAQNIGASYIASMQNMKARNL